MLTQYSNLHNDATDKFYIPENVYIIGTMNDIDRSVEPFDFAMRRRFRFIEIKPEDTQDAILSNLNTKEKGNAINKMGKINEMIRNNPDLGSNYQLGAAYFAKLRDLNNSYNELWEDYLKPLLHDYLQGTGDAKAIEEELKNMRDVVVDNKSKNASDSGEETAKDEETRDADEDSTIDNEHNEASRGIG